MWDNYRTSYQCRYAHGLVNFFGGEPYLFAFAEVILHAVVTAKHERAREPYEFFRFNIEGTFLVCIGIEVEDPFDNEIIGPKNLLVHARAIVVELVH